MRLHHVQVVCPSGGEGAARRFYGGLLGLPEVEKPPALATRGGVWFRGPGVELHVSVDEPCLPAQRAHPAFVLDADDVDIDALALAVGRAGHPVTWDGEFPGHHRFYTADAAGNRVEILQAI